MSVQGSLLLSGQQFSNKSEIQKSLNYPIEGVGVKPNQDQDITPNFAVWNYYASPMYWLGLGGVEEFCDFLRLG